MALPKHGAEHTMSDWWMAGSRSGWLCHNSPLPLLSEAMMSKMGGWKRKISRKHNLQGRNRCYSDSFLCSQPVQLHARQVNLAKLQILKNPDHRTAHSLRVRTAVLTQHKSRAEQAGMRDVLRPCCIPRKTCKQLSALVPVNTAWLEITALWM